MGNKKSKDVRPVRNRILRNISNYKMCLDVIQSITKVKCMWGHHCYSFCHFLSSHQLCHWGRVNPNPWIFTLLGRIERQYFTWQFGVNNRTERSTSLKTSCNLELTDNKSHKEYGGWNSWNNPRHHHRSDIIQSNTFSRGCYLTWRNKIYIKTPWNGNNLFDHRNTGLCTGSGWQHCCSLRYIFIQTITKCQQCNTRKPCLGGFDCCVTRGHVQCGG